MTEPHNDQILNSHVIFVQEADLLDSRLDSPNSNSKPKINFRQAFRESPCSRKEITRYLTFLLCTTILYGALVAVVGRPALPNYTPHQDESTSAELLLYNETSTGGYLVNMHANERSHSTIFGIYFFIVTGLVAGHLARAVRLPGLVGMIVVGVVFGNLGCLSQLTRVEAYWAQALRRLSFACVLVRGGLALDSAALRRLGAACLLLAFTPCVVEALVVAAVSALALRLPIQFGLMLGFVLGAVSPAVVVPGVLGLAERGLGVDEGVPTLLIAASSIDDVLAITAFSGLIAVTFANGSIILTIIRGPMDVFIGLLFGVLLGGMLWCFPHPKMRHAALMRVALLGGGATLCMFGAATIRVDGAGAIGCLVAAFVAAHHWTRQLDPTAQTVHATVVNTFDVLWAIVFEPLLFGLIGAELDLATLDTNLIAMSALTLILGLFFRSVAAFAVLAKTGFNRKERLFVAFAWLPKATVQAALGTIVLDTALSKGLGEETELYGRQMLNVAVLSILLTAPLGAALISLTGPRLLRRKLSLCIKSSPSEEAFVSCLEFQNLDTFDLPVNRL